MICACAYFHSSRCKRGCPLKADGLTIFGIEHISSKNVSLLSMGSIPGGVLIQLQSSCSRKNSYERAHEDPHLGDLPVDVGMLGSYTELGFIQSPRSIAYYGFYRQTSM